MHVSQLLYETADFGDEIQSMHAPHTVRMFRRRMEETMSANLRVFFFSAATAAGPACTAGLAISLRMLINPTCGYSIPGEAPTPLPRDLCYTIWPLVISRSQRMRLAGCSIIIIIIIIITIIIFVVVDVLRLSVSVGSVASRSEACSLVCAGGPGFSDINNNNNTNGAHFSGVCGQSMLWISSLKSAVA